MINSYKTIYRGGCGEIVEKKSRFLAATAHVETEEEACAWIDRIKKQYWDANHNCFAYIIGKKQELMRCSDDGEPAQTAGRPILDVLLGKQICDVAVVVTRYFGGTLLGTGGLVRAYSKAVQEGLLQSVIVEKRLAEELVIETDYNGAGKIQYLLGKRGLVPENTDYTETVTIRVLVAVEMAEQLIAEITEGTGGRAAIARARQLYYGKVEGKTV